MSGKIGNDPNKFIDILVIGARLFFFIVSCLIVIFISNIFGRGIPVFAITFAVVTVLFAQAIKKEVEKDKEYFNKNAFKMGWKPAFWLIVLIVIFLIFLVNPDKYL